MKFKILHKLFLIAIIPTMTLTFFSLNNLNEKYDNSKAHKKLFQNLKLIEKSSNLLHDLQIERGLSSNYLTENKNRNYFKVELQKHRDISDKILFDFKQLYKTLDATVLTHSQLIQLKKVYEDISKIKHLRERVSSRHISASDSFMYYTECNNKILEFIKGLKLYSSKESILNNILAMQNIIFLQEIAGQERAFIGVILSKTKVTLNDMHKVYYFIQAQNKQFKYINHILENSQSKDSLKKIEQRHKGKAFYKTRNFILEQEETVLDSKEWFIITTQRIDSMHTLEHHIFLSIYKDLSANQAKLHDALIFQITLSMFTILLLLFITFLIAKKIEQSIKKLDLGIKYFFEFLNFQREEPYKIELNSKDEINDIAQNINAHIFLIQDNLGEDKDFIYEATQVVTMMKDGDFSERPYFEPHNPNLKELKNVLNELIDLIADKIKEQTTSLEQLNSSLEDKVFHQTVELHKKVDELTIARDKAIQAEVAKDEFLANMSHEIRTPLNAILGFVTILQKRIKEEKSLNYLNIIGTSGQSLLTIINDILDFSKIQSGKFTISPYTIDPVEEFSNATLLFASKAYEKHIVYAVYIDPNLPQSIKLDAVRAKQIISNILSNAIKFTPEDGAIKVKVTIQDSTLHISIQDNGIGISKENQSKVFSAFEQADGSTTRKYGGTGLGLSISSKLATLMNGSLTLTSEEGVGSTFSLKIPISIIDSSPRELIEKEKIDKYKFALLNLSEESAVQIKLIKKYLSDFGATQILELDSYTTEGYDILFFIPDETYNEEIIDSTKPAIAILRTSAIKLANFNAIKPLYAPFSPSSIIETINDIGIDKIQITSPQLEDESEKTYIGKLLVAEDNKTNQMLISLILDDYEIDYKIAQDGVEAVEFFKQDSYDMVLMDENMPELNGIEAMKQIKDYEKSKNLLVTPIIALTASVLDTDKEMFLNAGMDGFVGKPIDTKELEIVFDKYLKRKG